jgi:hypothetical protein
MTEAEYLQVARMGYRHQFNVLPQVSKAGALTTRREPTEISGFGERTHLTK